MSAKGKQSNKDKHSRNGKTDVHQGDVLLVHFGNEWKGSRSLCGNRPVYVMSSDDSMKTDNVLLVIPLFRSPSRDTVSKDVEIRTIDCRGLRYPEYAQVMNMQKISRHQVIKRIGRVKSESVHKELLSAMWGQVGEQDEKY